MAEAIDTSTTQFNAGVDAIEKITAEFTTEDWAKPACGEWTAEETARHILAVVDWYHQWLDRAVSGQSDPLFPASELDSRNAAELRQRSHLNGAEAVSQFVQRARDYISRAAEHWDLPFGFPFGTVTVGEHVAIAATEWHLHAWDLTSGDEQRHEPENAAELFTAVGLAMAETKGGLQRRIMKRAVPLVSNRSPWETILKQSGRSAQGDSH